MAMPALNKLNTSSRTYEVKCLGNLIASIWRRKDFLRGGLLLTFLVPYVGPFLRRVVSPQGVGIHVSTLNELNVVATEKTKTIHRLRWNYTQIKQPIHLL